MTAAEILRAAADVLRRDGWCQGDHRKGGAHCVMSALYTVSENGDAPCAHMRAIDALVLVGGYGARWNDAPGRTAEEVLSALERAAVLAEAGQ